MTRARMSLAATLLLFAAVAADAQDLPRDFFLRELQLRDAAPDSLQRLLQDVVMDRRGAERRLETWAQRHPQAPPVDRSAAWGLLCERRYHSFRYRAALTACSEAEAAQRGSTGNTLGWLHALATAPPISWDRPALRVALRDNRVIVSNGPESTDAMVDTGAQVAVVMESVAHRLGAHDLPGEVEVATTTAPVAGRIVMFDRLSIGGASLRHLPALVLPDAQLTIPNGPTLHMILSLWSLAAERRVAYLEHGSVLALGRAAPPVQGIGAPLYWDESGVGFAVDFNKQRRAVDFDTGANRSYLFPTALAALSDTELASRETFDRRLGGIGGDRIEHAARLHNVTFGVAGHAWRFDTIDVAQNDLNGEAARIGIDLTARFSVVVLDFSKMRLGVVD